jgi:type IV secretion system protein VirB3
MVPREVIYKGATRPAMRFGIPLVPLVVLFGCGALLMLWGGVLLSGWIALAVLLSFVPALVWMHFVTRRDDQRFHQMFIHLKLWLHDRNARLWRARSYTPALPRGVRHDWHA